MEQQIKRLRGSSSAFMWGRLVHTDYPTGCLRNILLGSHGLKETVSGFSQDMGLMNENLYSLRLDQEGSDEIQREVPVSSPIDGIPAVTFSGRVDYIIKRGAQVRVDEVKATQSKNKLKAVIKDGRIVTENLAQLVSYMLTLKTTLGRIVYSFYAPNKKTAVLEAGADRTFNVEVDGSGRIMIDGKSSIYTVDDQLAHRNAAAHCIDTGEVWDRPLDWDSTWKSPCKYCPFQAACDKYDLHEIEASEFVAAAAAALTAKKECADE